MKRTILIEVFLFLVSCILLILSINSIRSLITWIDYYKNFLHNDISLHEFFKEYHITPNLVYGILELLALFMTYAAIVLIALKDFAVFKPLLDKYEAKFQAHKEKRAAVKAEKAEADRQAKIAELEQQLNELKKDE